MKIYIAGKVSNHSVFGTHDWRKNFCAELEKLSGLKLENLDPIKFETDTMKTEEIFAKDCYLIREADIVVVYLSDDISVGGSQEILIAKYFAKPVIGLAPRGGKFNGNSRKIGGRMVKDYRDPFVFSTCDAVCGNIREVSLALEKLPQSTPPPIKTIDLIGKAAESFAKQRERVNG